MREQALQWARWTVNHLHPTRNYNAAHREQFVKAIRSLRFLLVYKGEILGTGQTDHADEQLCYR